MRRTYRAIFENGARNVKLEFEFDYCEMPDWTPRQEAEAELKMRLHWMPHPEHHFNLRSVESWK